MKTILVVDYQTSSSDLLRNFLTKKNYDVETATKGESAFKLIGKKDFDLIICDYRLPDMDGTEFFDILLKVKPESKIIFTSKEINFRNAVDLVKKGVFNYLLKPINPDELLQLVIEATSKIKNNTSRSNIKCKVKPNNESNKKYVIGRSQESINMMKQILKVGPTNYTVIIQGETGTGKESIARMVHNESLRKNKPFIAIDCGSISKEIAGSELFGHEKGAFTGAISNKTGLFELAEGGTIFLDEIANLSLETQMALLRALQEKVVRKIGGTEEVSIDVRVIVATNEDLRMKSGNNGFRDDLFFRLNEFVLTVPSLRDRKVDLPLFIDFFLDVTAKELNILKPTLSNEVIYILEAYHWPGNIRELKNTIRRACLFVSKDNFIYPDALPISFLQRNHYPTRVKQKENGNKSLENSEKSEDTADLKSTTTQAESKKIVEVLRLVRFNKTKAAEMLNIHRKTLYTKLKMMNIDY